jgi:thymidylate kinase
MQQKIVLIAFIAISIIAFFICRFIQSHSKPGMIILINGVSSTGKSAIIAELKKIHPEFKIFNVDETWPEQVKQKATSFGWNSSSDLDPWMYLHNYLIAKDGTHYLSTQVRQKLFDNFPTFYEPAKKEALRGIPVIIDPVFEFEKEYSVFADYFNDMPNIKVLVYCPMDILLSRVEKRNKSGIKDEERTAFQSFEQFPGNFKLQENADEPIIDVLKSSVLKKAFDDALQQLISNNIPAGYLPVLEKFKQDFIKQFMLNEKDEIIIVPKHHYDLILNSGNQAPKALAEQIGALIKLN